MNHGEVFNHAIDLGQHIAPGVYLVNIRVNDQLYTQRPCASEPVSSIRTKTRKPCRYGGASWVSVTCSPCPFIPITQRQ